MTDRVMGCQQTLNTWAQFDHLKKEAQEKYPAACATALAWLRGYMQALGDTAQEIPLDNCDLPRLLLLACRTLQTDDRNREQAQEVCLNYVAEILVGLAVFADPNRDDLSALVPYFSRIGIDNQVLFSDDAGTGWTPLCGLYANVAAAHAPSGTPDGPLPLGVHLLDRSEFQTAAGLEPEIHPHERLLFFCSCTPAQAFQTYWQAEQDRATEEERQKDKERNVRHEKNDYDRLYANVNDHPLFKRMASVYKRGAPLLPDRWYHDKGIEEGVHLDLWRGVNAVVDRINDRYGAVFGPTIQLLAKDLPDLGKAYILDYSDELWGNDLLRFPEDFEWCDSGLYQAARAYRSECGWDCAPGEAGHWLICCVLTDGSGTSSRMAYSGNILGFVILHDRDEDDEYESLAHLWVAESVRGKGVARMLVKNARERFPLKKVEFPATESGLAFLQAVWPEAIPSA